MQLPVDYQSVIVKQNGFSNIEMDKKCDLVCLVFTSVADHASYFYFEGKIANWFEKDFLSHTFIEKLTSRKKQIVPLITEIIQRNV